MATLPDASGDDERVSIRVIPDGDEATEYTFRAWVEESDGNVVISPLPTDVPFSIECVFELSSKTARDGVYGPSGTVQAEEQDVTAAVFSPYDILRVNTSRYHTLDDFTSAGGGD